MINGTIEDVFSFEIRSNLCACGDARCTGGSGTVVGRGIRLRVRPWDQERSVSVDIAPTNYVLTPGDWLVVVGDHPVLHQRTGHDEYAEPVILTALPLDPRTQQPRPYTVPEL